MDPQQTPAVFNNVPVGTYTLTVTKAGYRTATESITITDGCDITKNYELVAASGKLTVTSTPADATATLVLA